MGLHAWIALAVLVAATTLFITRWVPLALTALGIPVVLFATGVLKDVNDALMGFGNHAVLAIGAVMILGGALRESGVATLMARGIQRVGGKSELGLLLLFMVATAGLAAFMNNTAVVAILLPVAAALSRRSGVASSRLFMPMAFAAVLGGTISLIGTAPNFIAADYYNNQTAAGKADPLGIFDYAAVGIPITIAGIVFMALIGRLLLPTTTSRASDKSGQRDAQEAARDYGLQSKLFEMRVVPASGVAGKTLKQANVRARFGLGVVAIHRPSAIGSRWFQPEPDLELEAEDHLFLVGDEESAWEFAETEMLQFGLADNTTIERLLERGTSMAEVSPSPHSGLIGRTLREIDFQKRYGLGVIGYWRRNEAVTDLGTLKLQLGDAFLVAGRPRKVHALESDPDFVVLTDPSHREDVGRAPLAIAILLLALVPSVFFDFPLAVSALGGACLMVLTGCLAKRHVPKTIDWSVLALLAGTLPLGAALEQQGLSQQVADMLGGVAGGAIVTYALLFLISATFSVLTSNAAAAAIVAPVAAATASAGAGVDAKSALLAMAYGCSCNFLLPFAQCNLLVMTPGGYSTRDYVRVGAGMSVVMAVTTIVTLAVLAG